jgi:hypothetical protein
MVSYLLENTESLFSTKNRSVRFTYKQMSAYFGTEHLLLHKLIHLHHTSLMETSNLGDLKEIDTKKVDDIAPEIKQAKLDLVVLTRKFTVLVNARIFDISWNHFNESYMEKALSFMKICALDLTVLKLDGNYLGLNSLKII